VSCALYGYEACVLGSVGLVVHEEEVNLADCHRLDKSCSQWCANLLLLLTRKALWPLGIR
jgi:hypothetical protein